MTVRVHQTERQNRRVKVQTEGHTPREEPHTRPEGLCHSRPVSLHHPLHRPEGGLRATQHGDLHPLEEGEDQETVGHLVAGLGEVDGDVSAGGRGQGAEKEGEEAQLNWGQLPPAMIGQLSSTVRLVNPLPTTDAYMCHG